MKFWAALSLYILSLPAFASTEREACIHRLEQEFATMHELQSAQYLALDQNAGRVRENNGGRFLPGNTDKAFIILHGFAASPFEVEDIGRLLHAAGGTVYMPLLPGFGSSAEVANSYSNVAWRELLVYSMELFSRCFEEVSLAGFSTGGSLVTDFLLNGNVSRDGIYHRKLRVKKAALLSPYYEINSALAGVMNRLASWFTDSINVSTIYRWNAMRDLEVFFLHPNAYNQEIPLKAAAQVVQLGKELREKAKARRAKSTVPLFVAYSEADETVDTEMIPKFVNAHFAKAKMFRYLKEEGVPHQIAVKSVNPAARELVERTAAFLW